MVENHIPYKVRAVLLPVPLNTPMPSCAASRSLWYVSVHPEDVHRVEYYLRTERSCWAWKNHPCACYWPQRLCCWLRAPFSDLPNRGSMPGWSGRAHLAAWSLLWISETQEVRMIPMRIELWVCAKIRKDPSYCESVLFSIRTNNLEVGWTSPCPKSTTLLDFPHKTNNPNPFPTGNKFGLFLFGKDRNFDRKP